MIETRGIETVAAETGIDEERLGAIADDAPPSAAGAPDREEADERSAASDLTLEEAASILAVSEEAPDADAVVMEVRDHLLMGMTTGVLDVDTLAGNIEADLSGQEVQQAIEGRSAMTLDELAAIHRYIAGRNA